MANQGSRVKKITLRVYVDRYGDEYITPIEYINDELNAYALVHQEDICITFPSYDVKEAQAEALRQYSLALGDKCTQKQVEIENQIKQLTGDNHE